MTDATTPPEPDDTADQALEADLDALALDSDLALALELADLADRAAMERFRAVDLQVDTKPDRTYVTEADLAVERAVRELIARRRPADGVLGEEYGTAGSGARQWIVDPIDGTSNFLRGVPVWGALIALTVDGAPVVGVASMPALGRRWWGAQGLGAFTTDVPGGEPRAIRVSQVGGLADASLSFQSIAQWRDAGQLDRLLALGERVWRDRAYGDLWSYCLLAEGLVDIVAEFDLKPWDIAAAVPIIEAAGGRVTSTSGAALGDGSVLATNGRLHSAVLDVLGSGATSGTA
ncbi:histidinol-phosphatase [Agromyces aurantiacus]|uniref:Histidinol-phosphatase n=1 Tax=Agromyces aurantiacus TaxID=165814 RepID=A0ABV9R8A5_9MICO|nr:histidinol-phosphatase [Agromyces aurantiacus]MBM7505151.1 histidinol-phosphatase [Agromyces aurantiacus]